MSRTFNKSNQLFQDQSTSLLNGESFDSGWQDLEKITAYQISVFAGSEGLTLRISSSEMSGGSGVNDFTNDIPLLSSYLSSFPPRERYMRFQIVNETGSTVNNVKFEIKEIFTAGTGASVFPIYVNPVPFSQALLTQSVLIGQDTSGHYKSAQLNQAGAVLSADFGTEVSRGLYSGYSIDTKFGRNPDIDTNSDPEDMWNGGDVYTGFNATSGEDIEIFSEDVNDTGSEITSGNSTGGSQTTLIDSGAAFQTSGVAVGDILLNDTISAHGVVTSVDSETQITVFTMKNGAGTLPENSSGNAYRIARSTSTGASVVQLSNLLDSNYEEISNKYIILNGSTGVTLSGDYLRCPRCKVIAAGSSGLNEGQLTVRQSISTTNIFCIVPTFGQSTIGCFTVPANKTCIIKRISMGITRANGSDGSATMLVNTREFGGAWNAKRAVEISTGNRYNETFRGGIIVNSATDVKVTISQVSDNGTIADSEIEYFFIDN